MSAEPSWLPFSAVVCLNQDAVNRTGEPFGIKNESGIDGSLNRARQHFHYSPQETHDDIVLLGAKLCIGVSQAQGFLNGNKRAALGAMEMFFHLNGFMLSDRARASIGELILKTCHEDQSKRMTDDDFAAAIDEFVVPISPAMEDRMKAIARKRRIEGVASDAKSMLTTGKSIDRPHFAEDLNVSWSTAERLD